MCNLYSQMKGPAAILAATRAAIDPFGKLPPMPGIFPDTSAPIVRNGTNGRELVMARWGMPSPNGTLAGMKTDPGTLHVRNTASAHWRRWLGAEHRCLVPFTSFCQPERLPDGRPPPWFALGPDRPLAFFAGIHAQDWTSTRRLRQGEESADLFAFLTCQPNAEIATLRTKAIPVILTTAEQVEAWMTTPASAVAAMQQPLPDGALQVVARSHNLEWMREHRTVSWS